MSASDDDLDRPLWGAAAIAREANVLDEHGNVDRGHIPATKTGQAWTSTPRRIRRHFAGEA